MADDFAADFLGKKRHREAVWGTPRLLAEPAQVDDAPDLPVPLRLDASWIHFRVTTPGPITMAAGTQLRGPYALWHHTHEFEPTEDGGCEMRDTVRYAIPFGPLGALAHRLFVRRDLGRIFDFRREAFAARFQRA